MPSGVLWLHRSHFAPVPSLEWRDAEGVLRFRQTPNPDRQLRDMCTEHGLLSEVMELLASVGHSSVVVTQTSADVHRYPRVGDVLSCCGPRIESVIGPKHTALGEGYFSTCSYQLRDASHALVADWMTTRLHFSPDINRCAEQEAVPVDDVISVVLDSDVVQEGSAFTQGQRLPTWVVEVTPTLIIAGALTTRDAQDVHHDAEAAMRRGFNGVFMNNFTTMALVDWYLVRTLGSRCVVKHFGFRLGRPQYASDALRFDGRIVRVDGSSSIDVNVQGRNRQGMHVECLVRAGI